MIYFDLDGVLRDLYGAAKINPKKWNCYVKGIPYVDYIFTHKKLLTAAEPTEYLTALNKSSMKINIITNQPREWVIPTIKWMHKNINNLGIVIFDPVKLPLLKVNDLLIEDYPFFNDYSQVLVIDRLYNRDIKLQHKRIKSPSQLINELYTFKRIMKERSYFND